MKLMDIKTGPGYLSIWFCRSNRTLRDYTKTLNIMWHYKWWKTNGVPPQWGYRDNGAKRSSGDKCLDRTLSLGYLSINLIDWDLQGDLA